MASLPSLADEKRAVRRAMRQHREAMGADERVRLSAAAAGRLLALPELGCAAVIAGFAPLGAEIDVGPALEAVARRGADLVFPRVSPQVPRLRFHRVGGPADLVVGAFGVREPAAHLPEVPVEAIDVMVLPGLAFDPQGGRLGYGGGYYDEVAARVRGAGLPRRCFLVGVGFDVQILERCPVGDGDVAIDCVVTDTRVIRCEQSCN